MKLCNYPRKLTVIGGEALDYFTGSITEQCRFNIIPLSRNAVKLICFPETGEYFILHTEIRSEVYKHHAWLPFYVPASGPDIQSFLGGNSLPLKEHGIIRREFRVCLVIAPDIRPNENIIVPVFVSGIQRLG